MESLPAGGPAPEPARPSPPGKAGPAARLEGDVDRGRTDFGLYCAACHGPEGIHGIQILGRMTGVCPPLNPIDPTLVNPDYSAFATDVDLFIEHGSVPAGEGPQIMMPSFGDWGMPSNAQTADLIAYVLHLNGVDKMP